MAWDLLGNSGTDSDTDFLGTADAKDLVLKVDNTEVLRLTHGDKVLNVGVNSDTPLQPYLAITASAPCTLQTLKSLTSNTPVFTAIVHGKGFSNDTSTLPIDFVNLDDGDVAIYEATVTAICIEAGNGVSLGDTLARKMTATFHNTGGTVTIDHQQNDFSYSHASLSAANVTIDASFNQMQLNIHGVDTAVLSWVSESKWTKHGA